MITLQDFHTDFLQSILSDTQSRGLTKPKSFFENVCEDLVLMGDLTNNYIEAEYIKKNMEIYGYDYDEEREYLTLISSYFFQDDEIQTLNKNHIDTKFKKLKTFFIKSFDKLYESMEQSFEHYSMAYNIYYYLSQNKIKKVKLMLISDGKATRNLLEINNESIENIEIEYRVIDIEYLYKFYLSENTSGDFEIDINIPALQVKVDSNQYKSFLSVINGKQLVEIYKNFGQKLFEQNVRTFLQFRGSVNKGLKNTIEYQPDMFFAYNNGITATASDVWMNESGSITKISNFQIVNGGQTTSAIYAAYKNSKLDVSKIYVQMKLSVVNDKEKQNDFISKVSEYANTQNKINKSDFFSNSVFHKEFKNYSKRIWVQAAQGIQRRTHWFYERVRGEYLNEQAYLSAAQQKQFQFENPKNQLLDKTFLSKSENLWLQKPDIVSKGAQYSFSYFADIITEKLEKNSLAINENYFKESIAKVIIFRETEKIISQASWYNGGYRAQAVAYSISYLSYILAKENKILNFNLIWEEQKLPKKLYEILETITCGIYENITNPPEGNANIGQWCKKSQCWERVKQIQMKIWLDEDILLDEGEEKYNKKEAIKEKKLDNSIEIESFVIKLEKEKWQKLLKYYQKSENKSEISIMQLDILEKYTSNILILPSPKQAKILYLLYKQALDDGFIF